MKNLIVSLAACCLYFCCLSQANNAEDTIYFSKGPNLGGKKVLVDDCAKELGSTSAITDAKATCSCILDVLAKYYTQEQFSEGMRNENSGQFMADAMANGAPPRAELMECITSHVQTNMDSLTAGGEVKLLDENGKSEDYAKGFEIGFISSCEEAARASKEMADLGVDVKFYCNCVMDKIKTEGVSMGQLADLQDPNSVVFNRVVAPCFNDALLPENKVTKGKDIIGKKDSEKVPLISSQGVYKVKVKVGKTEKYFFLDSGAGETFINSGLEEELLKSGVIKEGDYLASRKFLMANGEYAECRRVKINGLEIGGYTVNNVVAAISNNAKALLLLGKTVLDKFSHWSIDNKANVLILNR